MSATAMAMRQYKQCLIDKGRKQGIKQGAFELALKIKDDLGLDVAVELSGFSRQELEKGKLNR